MCVPILDGYASIESTIITDPFASTPIPTTIATISSTSASATKNPNATKFGSSSDEQLLYFTTTMVGGDESTIPISATAATTPPSTTAAATANGTISFASPPTTIARFTVTPVPDEVDPQINNILESKEELYLIDKLQLNQFALDEVSEDEILSVTSNNNNNNNDNQNNNNQISLSSSTSTSCCSSSTTPASCCATDEKQQQQQQKPIQQPTKCLIQSSSNSSQSSSVGVTSSSDQIGHTTPEAIKLYRKHRPSTQYQEYKV